MHLLDKWINGMFMGLLMTWFYLYGIMIWYYNKLLLMG